MTIVTAGARPPPPAPPGHATHGWHADKKRLLMALLGLLVGVEFVENGMFVFAASHIVGGVDAAPREFAQVQAAYAVGSMLMIVLQQSLSRHFGYRRYLVGALALFMAGATASAASRGLAELTLARLVQGLGGGALFTSGRVLVPMLFAPADRPRALKYFMLILFSCSAVAPILAARLVDSVGWQWIFIAVLPLATMALVSCWLLLPDGVGRGGEPVNWAAGPLLLGALALTLLQLALSEARYDLFAHPLRLALVSAVGLGLLSAFLVHQWHHDSPFLRVRELRHPTYMMGLALYFLHYMLSNASSYLFPIFAERGLGFPLVTTGWLNAFAAVISLAGAWIYVKFGSRLQRKKGLMAAGALMLALSAWEFSILPPDAPPALMLLALVAKGLFGVMLVLPVAGLTFRDLGDERFAHGYQSKNLMRQIAGSFSAAVAAITLQDREFANAVHVGSTTDTHVAANWFNDVQAAFAAQGFAPAQAHEAALTALSKEIEQQALLLACGDLYRLLAVLACIVAVIVLIQRQLK